MVLPAAIDNSELLRVAARIAREKLIGQPYLFEVVHAVNALGARFGAGQRRQQHGRQDGDDGDHDQQLDQSESRLLFG